MSEGAKVSSDAFLFDRPFGRASELIMQAWWPAAAQFVQIQKGSWRSASFINDINNFFAILSSLPTQKDPHITDGLYGSVRILNKKEYRDNPSPTRPYMLLYNHFSHPMVLSSSGPISSRTDDIRNRPKQYLFSPFFLLREMLTVPENPASDAYAHAVVRAEIFKAALDFDNVFSKRKQPGSGVQRIRDLIKFENVGRALQKAEAYRRKGDTFYFDDPTDFIVGHLLASRGLALLTFAPNKQSFKPARSHERMLVGRDTFLASQSLVLEGGLYEFRFVNDLAQLPSASELLNELDGIPLAIPGLDVILARGLRTTATRGVVGRISGASGSGKTSLALGISAALAPLGVATRYISCEEDPEDLKQRLVTLTPSFITRTNSYSGNLDWFTAVHLEEDDPIANMLSASAIVDDMLDAYRDAGIDLVKDSPPGLSPLLVVIDGVHELVRRAVLGSVGEGEALHALIEKFRSLGAIIIVLSADTDEAALSNLDYIVDFVFKLGSSPDKTQSLEAARQLVLHKTRLQFSRPGMHLLHISKRDGIKTYPSLAAQLELFSNTTWKPANKARWFDFLQTGLPRGGKLPRPLVRIYESSQILVTGRGSGGKAGFALKLLTKPFVSASLEPELDLNATEMQTENVVRPRRRILIVSFLYGDDYYRDLERIIQKSSKIDSVHPMPDFELDVLPLYPGYLSPEVLIARIVRRLTRYVVEGEPVAAILIDGLHNVFLQYPLLQDSLMVWPVIFEICRTLGLTVIVTHTRFEVRGMDSDMALRWDVEAATRRVGPLLQSLVNSADFYMDLSPEIQENETTLYKVDLVSALGQEVRPSNFYWHRSDAYVVSGKPDAIKPKRK